MHTLCACSCLGYARNEIAWQNKTPQRRMIFLLCRVSDGSGGWIRTIDLRVMSPTSCHCSTPRWEWRTDLVSQRSNRQYLRRCRVSRPGSGWNGVGPRRFAHATGSGASAECLGWDTAINRSATAGLPAGKPSSMRSRRLHPSRGLQLGPLSQSSPGGLTRL